MQEFIAAQSTCKDVQELINSPSLCIKKKPHKQGTLFVDTSTGQERMLVPTILCKQVFGALHNMAHPSIRGTKRLIMGLPRTMLRPERRLQRFAAERVFGLRLCLPRPLLDLPEAKDQTLAHRFKDMMSGVPLRPLVPTSSKQLPPAMAWAYLRVDQHKPALAQLYEGHYQVLRQSRNTATLQMGPRTETVNLERLKPYVGLEAPVPALP